MRAWLIALAAAMTASCGAGLMMTSNVSVNTGSYAAMDEVPVGGGELRLVEPKVTVFDGTEREVIAFPLKHTAIRARVGASVAVYEVTQEFENPFAEAIEAVYVFPLGDDGAVSGYEMTIGNRTITGEIHTRAGAQKIYTDAKERGHTAGLVEQNKANVFTQRVVNIAPREAVKVKMTYVEMLDHKDGSYEMAVPLVVGPRYLPPGARGVAARHAGDAAQPGVTSIPYVDATRASSTVSFEADIDAGVPIAGIASPSHDVVREDVSPTRTRVTLGKKHEIPNRDLIVRFTTAGPKTTVGVLAHKRSPKDDGYFLLEVQPKATYASGDMVPREVLIVIDRSGSMDGAPLAQAKAVASGIIDTLHDFDTFNIIGFASGVDAMTPSVIAGNAAGKAAATTYLQQMIATGGTQMEAGVAAMLSNKPVDTRIRVVYFLTDGYVGNDDVVVDAARNLLGTNRIFTVGIGAAPNRALLDRLARAGRGYASYLTLTESAGKLAKSLVARSAYPYMTDIQIDWGGLDVVDLTPAQIPDIYAGQPLVISGRYRRPGAGKVIVTANTGTTRTTIPLDVRLLDTHDFEPVASLWARRQIEALTADSPAGSTIDTQDQERITALGLKFHLITEFTSFVAVDRSRVVQSDGKVKLVEQAAIVPEGTTLEATASTPPPSRRSYDDGGSFGGWSGGSDDNTAHRLVFTALALLLVTWLLGRRYA